MACMCGDLCCSSCGPAQGNHRCENCGKWSMDGGCDDPAACAEACRLANEAMAKEYEAMEKAEAEYEELEAIRAVNKGEWFNDDGGI